MSVEQLQAFLEKVKGDSNLQAKLKAAKSPEDVVGIAKEHGFEFTADKITEISKEELEGMAGGCGVGGQRRIPKLVALAHTVGQVVAGKNLVSIIFPLRLQNLHTQSLCIYRAFFMLQSPQTAHKSAFNAWDD
ncbi:Nif11-like leader peptide family natural product precursor [Synechococcus sp. UW179A]|uniref:Nif11-like leader peptide family natural product precursor n=1 Tax=Synechococcus sp. UW179A TaxID=2575510 RepID=UPI000E0F2A82